MTKYAKRNPLHIIKRFYYMDEVNMTKYVKRKSFTYNKGVILHGLKMIKGEVFCAETP